MNFIKSILTMVLIMTGTAVYAVEAVNTFGAGGSFFSDPDRTGVAIKGTDTVAYFTQNKPVPGKDEFSMSWKSAKWKFSSKENLELFKANPEKYAPQYGGYCAYGVAKDNLVKIEPELFTILDGKLYLNYDADIMAKWKKDPKGYIKIADEKFNSLIKGK